MGQKATDQFQRCQDGAMGNNFHKVPLKKMNVKITLCNPQPSNIDS